MSAPRFPTCDSYVTARKKAGLPMGTLANSELRHKCLETHRVFNRLWESGLMTRKSAYLWLRAKLGLPEDETHIGRFSTFRCEQVIQLCESFYCANKKVA